MKTATTWQAKVSEANDAIGSARTALLSAHTAAERRMIEEEINWWQGRLAAVNATRLSEVGL